MPVVVNFNIDIERDDPRVFPEDAVCIRDDQSFSTRVEHVEQKVMNDRAERGPGHALPDSGTEVIQQVLLHEVHIVQSRVDGIAHLGELTIDQLGLAAVRHSRKTTIEGCCHT